MRDDRDPLDRLGETERRFEIMADAAPVLLWMAREDGKCTFFNQTWLDFTGRSLEEEWGVGWAEGVHFEDLQRCLDTYVDAFGARKAFEMEYRLLRADGVYRWILDRGVPRFTPDGHFAGYIGSCVDITDHKRVESELRTAVTAKDEFLGLVSHEMRSPVTALALQIERIRRSSDNLTERQLHIVERMGNAMKRLTQLIESVLEFSRIERGRLVVEPHTYDATRLLQEELDAVRPVAERKGLQVALSIPVYLPSVYSDPALLRLIVSNLLNNAVKFTEQGSVTLEGLCDGRTLRVAVRDTGRGIAPEQHERVFEPFEQLEPTRSKHTPGVGLGLALARALTSSLEGTIALESALGKGSTFTISIPISYAGG